MCLLFFYYNPNPKRDEFKLILINNRDEDLRRPTKQANFWLESPNIIGGTDDEPGKQGGTWLAMNRNGKIACLLNIFQPKSDTDPNKKGRGFLVRDFVTGKETAKQYLDNIRSEGDCYNGFLLFSMNISSNELSYYTNMGQDKSIEVEPGFHSFGNSPPARLWEKAKTGGQKFKEIVEANMKCSQKVELIEALETMLGDKTQYPVDDQLAKQGRGYPEAYLKKLHSIFVEIPEHNYGTRSHTFILVDANGEAEFIESSTGCISTSSGLKTFVDWERVVEKFTLAD